MTINILALGESLSEYKESKDLTVGVNDIFSRIKTDFVVCIDHPSAFNNERLETIKKTECKGFFSQIDEWNNIPNFNKIEFNRGSGILDGLDSPRFCYSNSSPYVAAVLAYKLGAKEIVLYGADFVSHKHFINHSKDKALRDFKSLRVELNKRGVDLKVCSSFSELSKVLPLANL